MNQDIKNQKSKLSNKKFWYVFTLSVLLLFSILNIYLIIYNRSDITYDKLKEEFKYIISYNVTMFILLVIYIIIIIISIMRIVEIDNEIDKLPK